MAERIHRLDAWDGALSLSPPSETALFFAESHAAAASLVDWTTRAIQDSGLELEEELARDILAALDVLLRQDGIARSSGLERLSTLTDGLVGGLCQSDSDNQALAADRNIERLLFNSWNPTVGTVSCVHPELVKALLSPLEADRRSVFSGAPVRFTRLATFLAASIAAIESAEQRQRFIELLDTLCEASHDYAKDGFLKDTVIIYRSAYNHHAI